METSYKYNMIQKKIKSFFIKTIEKSGALFLLFLLTLSLFLGCTKKEESVSSSSEALVGWPVTVNGTQIDLPPTRIASLSPALTEMLYDFGLGSQVVAVSDYCNYPEAAVDLPKIGTALTLNLEKIRNYAPDCLVVQSALSAENTAALAEMGVNVVVLPPVTEITSVSSLYQQIFYLGYGAKVGKDKGENYRKETDDALLTLKTALPAKDWTAAYLVGVPNTAATTDTFEQSILTELKLTNVATEGTGWNFTDEQLVAADPDVLIVSTDMDIEAFKAEETHTKMKAVVNNRIYPADQIVFERQTPRMLEELEILARYIYGNEYGVAGTTSIETTDLSEPAVESAEASV